MLPSSFYVVLFDWILIGVAFIGKMKSDDDKVLSFKFESGELIYKTEDYEINDIIKVKLYEIQFKMYWN